MYKFFISLLLVLFFAESRAQDKKVAVVTFFADKMIDLSEFGLSQTADLLKLDQNPDFNMTPMLNDFHKQFFENYAANFPFKLVPEADVLGQADYKSMVVQQAPFQINDLLYTTIDGYKVINYNWGTKNEKYLLDIFKQYDGIMFVFITFKMVKGFALNGTGTVKLRASTNIELLNREDKVVFSINESETSKKTGIVVGNIPVMTPEKILPMCSSALSELMEQLQKKLPKLVKKAEAKL